MVIRDDGYEDDDAGAADDDVLNGHNRYLLWLFQ